MTTLSEKNKMEQSLVNIIWQHLTSRIISFETRGEVLIKLFVDEVIYHELFNLMVWKLGYNLKFCHDKQ